MKIPFNTTEFLTRVSDKFCLVAGDIILDRYISGKVDRISPEAPIPVLRAGGEKNVPGGAANVAGNLRGFHIGVRLCGVVGEDDGAETVRGLMEERGVAFCGVSSRTRRTTRKTRAVSMNQQLLRIDEEDTHALSEQEERELSEKVVDSLSDADVVVLSDYNKGVCSESFCSRLLAACRAAGKPVVVDPKCSDWTKYAGAYLITPNFKELTEACGEAFPNTPEAIAAHAMPLMERYELEQILVTRSQHGMTLVRRGTPPLTFAAVRREVYDVSGAGDTVVATVAAFLTAGYPLEEALEAANVAAGISVSKAGTYAVSLEELAAQMGHAESEPEEKLWSREHLDRELSAWRGAGETVVFTNGCFDILHAGHVDYLGRAKQLGSRLIVGLNSDASVRRLKGEGRPVNCQTARAAVLAALQCVDAVVVFEEDTPEELIRRVGPDYLVKGGDYRIEDIAGRQYAGKTLTIPLTPGYSTTGLLEKLSGGQEGGK